MVYVWQTHNNTVYNKRQAIKNKPKAKASYVNTTPLPLGLLEPHPLVRGFSLHLRCLLSHAEYVYIFQHDLFSLLIFTFVKFYLKGLCSPHFSFISGLTLFVSCPFILFYEHAGQQTHTFIMFVLYLLLMLALVSYLAK